MIVPLQDYPCDLLSWIAGEDVVFSNVTTVDSCSRDSGGRIFKSSNTDHMERNGHLDISNLTGALRNISRSIVQVAQRVLR